MNTINLRYKTFHFFLTFVSKFWFVNVVTPCKTPINLFKEMNIKNLKKNFL